MASTLLQCILGIVLISASTASFADDIVIGQVAPLSGSLAPTGNSLRTGMQLYINVTNAAGGIRGNKLKLVSKDDDYKSDQTVAQAKALIAEAQPIALAGVVGTGNVTALLKERILDTNGIPLVGVRSGATSVITSENPWLFLTRASYGNEVEKIVEQFVISGNKKYAVFYQNDAFGQDGLAHAEKLVIQYKGEIIARGSYEKNTADVGSAVKTIAAANPQVVIMISNTAASAEFVKQMRAAGNVSQLASISTTDGPIVAGKIGAETAKGLVITQVVPAPGALKYPLIREVQDAYAQFPQTEIPINHTVVEGYLMAKIIAEGVKKAGPNATRKQLRDALKTMKDRDMGGISVDFSGKNQAGLRFVDITILNREGKLIR